MNLIIIGGGISGLFMAYLAKKNKNYSNITIIERTENIGGLLQGFHYPEGRYFDKGTHLFRESGIKVIDDFLTSSFEESSMFYLPNHAYSGCIFNGKLQNYSHYPFTTDNYIRTATIDHLKNCRHQYNYENLRSYCYTAFGSEYSDRVLLPIAEKIYNRSSEDLSHDALKIIGQDRFLSANHDEWKCISSVSSLIAYPDQENLPEHIKNPYRRVYSKKQGTYSFVIGIANSLRSQGVNILTKKEIVSLDKNSIRFTDGNQIKILEFDKLAFATNIFATSKILGIRFPHVKHDKPLQHYVFNLELSKTPTSKLSFFYNFDSLKNFFRVTNYSRITDNSHDQRLSVEILAGDEAHINSKSTRQCLSELKHVGFIDDETEVIFERIEHLESGFPMLTNKNKDFISLLNTSVTKHAGEHFFLGRDEDHPPFLQNDVLRSICKYFPRYL
ncbi:NAD(P)-binding protein [Vreelandella stevensii]|uniref:NAD(P)-binding protein n=1 Tax=Vreelandella stevensii TaxID=502821 RepID=UPI0037496A23